MLVSLLISYESSESSLITSVFGGNLPDSPETFSPKFVISDSSWSTSSWFCPLFPDSIGALTSLLNINLAAYAIPITATIAINASIMLIAILPFFELKIKGEI